MSLSAWRASLRIARRDAWRHKLRSLVVVALVGLPVFAITAGDVLYRTWQLSPSEQLNRVIGSADGWLQWYGVKHIQQSPGAPWDGTVGWSGRSGKAPAPMPSDAAVRAALPAGSRVIAYRTAARQLSFYTKAGLAYASFIGLDYTDPIAHGIVHQLAGTAPAARDQVAITSQLADTTGLRVGDALRATDPTRTLHITAIVRETNAPHDLAVYALPSLVPVSSGAELSGGNGGWLINTRAPLTWHDVLGLNRIGYVALSRSVYLDPPPLSAQPLGDTSGGSASAAAIAASVLIAGMAILEVVLLAGPAFAVGARRRLHDLALLAAVGGGRADLRRSVLADALVLGLGAGLLSTALGVAAAAVAEPLIEPTLDHAPGTFTLRPLDLAVLVLISVATAMLAAVLPAVRVARLEVVATLAGRRGVTRSRRRWPIAGGVLIAVGAATGLGANSADVVLLGMAVLEVGVILATPLLIGLIARFARWLPPSGRIALRDAGRTRAASTPAVAAVMAAAIGATAALIAASSSIAHERSSYQPQLPRRDTMVDTTVNPGDAHVIAVGARRLVPAWQVSIVDAAVVPCARRSIALCATAYLTDPVAGSAPDASPNSELPSVIVAEPSSVAALYGAAEPAAASALAAGRIVVPPGYVRPDGTAALFVPAPSGHGGHAVLLRATAVRADFTPAHVIVPRSVLDRLGLRGTPADVLIDSSVPLTAAQRQALALTLARTGHAHPTIVENGYQNSADWVSYALVAVAAFVAIFAALLATALANLDSRPDLVALAAIGASPRTRRVLSMSRAAIIAGLGCVIGTLAGLVPASAWARSLDAPLVVPWASVAALLVGVPTVTALLAGAFTRARLPSE